MSKKKILFVLPFAPYPLSSGGGQAIFNGIDVVRDFFDVYVTYISDGHDEESMIKFNDLLEGKITTIPCVLPVNKRSRLTCRQKLYSLFFKIEKKLRRMAGFDFAPTRIPHKAWLCEELFPKDTFFSKYVCSIVEEYKIDIVQCEMLCNITIGMMLPKRIRKVFVHHELGWVIHELELQRQNGDAFEQKLWLEYYKTCEIALLNTYDDIITLSIIDTQKLINAGVKSKIHTSMAVVNTPTDQMVSTEKWNVLSFVGPDCNLPNITGLKWFLDNVWGQLLQKNNDYRLQIIGHWNEKRIAELVKGYKNVEYLGFVDDLSLALKDTVMIVPITIGSGIRMKILESASIGVPFVTTSVGVEGIPVKSGVHCLVADTSEEFCRAILYLQDIQVRKRLAANANRLVADCFSIDAFRKNRLEIYKKL